MKFVAITQRVDSYPNLKETRDALDQRLVDLLLEIDCIVVPVPNSIFNVLDVWLDKFKPEAFILSGGNDLGLCKERDLIENYLLDYASLHRVPSLGICRGMQMMASWAGGSLQTVQGHVGTRHKLTGEITGEVNSYHNFSIVSCPFDFKVLANSNDGHIEAIAHKSLPWEGWMWHPERENKIDCKTLKRIKCLFYS